MNVTIGAIDLGGPGGIARYAGMLARGLQEAGNEVRCIASSVGADVSPDLPVHRIPLPARPNSARLACWAAVVPRLMRKQAGSIIHTMGDAPCPGIVTAQSCHRAGMALHRQHKAPGGARRNFGIADRIRLHVESELYVKRKCSHVIAVSAGVKRELMEHYNLQEEQCTVIPNGVDITHFTPQIRQPLGLPLRRETGIPDDAFVLLLVANEFDRKGLNVILEALGVLADPAIRLVVLGKDDPRPYGPLVRAAHLEETVIFAGAVADPAPWYAAADLFVMPTVYEAFSLATLEAAASGLPLLVTKVNGTEDLVVDGWNGFFVQREADDLAARIRRCRDNKTLRGMLGIHARESAERFAWPRVVEATIAVYHRVGG